MNKFESSPVNKEFKRQLSNLEHAGEKPLFIVGVSGGPDSMALLYLLHRHKIKPVVIHCNYGLRGKQSYKDQKLVEEVCMLWNIECVAVKLDYDSAVSGNFQQWAREQRYRIFREIKRESDAHYILTAHHQDDQIETIFQKILRGSGLSALKGISYVNNDLFRPLLDVSKSQIIEFVQEFNIPYRIDGSNEESTYARNFLRNRWFPMIEDLFPGWRTNILALPDKAAVHKDLLAFTADKIRHDHQSFKRQAFHSLGESIKAVVFKELFDHIPINKGFLENISSIESLQTGQSLDISDDYKLHRDRDLYFVLSKSHSPKKMHAIKVSRRDLASGFQNKGIKMTIGAPPTLPDKQFLSLDIDKVTFPLTIRNWKDGDKFQPFGLDGNQLLSDHLTNRKIASYKKNEVMVMECFDGMIAAVIFPSEKDQIQPGTISNKVRISTNTREIIKIERIH